MTFITSTAYLVGKVNGHAVASFDTLAEAEAFAFVQPFETDIMVWNRTELV